MKWGVAKRLLTIKLSINCLSLPEENKTKKFRYHSLFDTVFTLSFKKPLLAKKKKKTRELTTSTSVTLFIT